MVRAPQLIWSNLCLTGRPTLHRDTKALVKHCANCQFHAAKAPAAPIQVHLTADYPGQVVAMGVLHLAKDTDCSGYMLIVIDVQGGGRENTMGREHLLCNVYFSTMRAATDKRSSSVERLDQVAKV